MIRTLLSSAGASCTDPATRARLKAFAEEVRNQDLLSSQSLAMAQGEWLVCLSLKLLLPFLLGLVIGMILGGIR
jgi:hypothetical protein